jgi:hypothetical protein
VLGQLQGMINSDGSVGLKRKRMNVCVCDAVEDGVAVLHGHLMLRQLQGM